MKTNILVLACLGILLILPSLVLADCVDIGSFSNFALTGTNTVTLYSGSQPAVKFDVQSCDVKDTSSIRLIKSYVCDGDEVMIDGSKCTVMSVTSSGM
jgi:hypothetical protein